KRRTALTICFYAIPDGKPLHTFPGICSNENGRDKPGHFQLSSRTDYGLIGAYLPSCHWLMS
ncbi:MAG: hypothetical protein E5W55_25515, partial [Mesorhizobium sp.]